MTAVPKSPRVSELRELFRNLGAFRAVYEETGLEVIRTPEGNHWSIWDLEYLCQQLSRLTPRQQQAITLCLIHNMREKDAARAMGVSVTNPVMMYATLGIQRLLDMVDEGDLARYRERELSKRDLASRRSASHATLLSTIRSQFRVVSNGCWVYPNARPGPPSLVVRNPGSPIGFIRVFPLAVLYRAEIGPIPEGSRLTHTTKIPPFSASCVNPHHAEIHFSDAYREKIQRAAALYRAPRRHFRSTYEEMLDAYLLSRKELVP